MEHPSFKEGSCTIQLLGAVSGHLFCVKDRGEYGVHVTNYTGQYDMFTLSVQSSFITQHLLGEGVDRTYPFKNCICSHAILLIPPREETLLKPVGQNERTVIVKCVTCGELYQVEI